jgi:hypothetical protein
MFIIIKIIITTFAIKLKKPMKIKSLTTSIILLIFVQFQSFAQIIPAYVPQNGIVGWYPFNGNANDESLNNNNGTVNGATLSTDRFGTTSAAYSFDGVNDFIEVTDNNSLDLGSTYSISLWTIFNPTSFVIGKYLLNKGCSPTPAYRIYYQDNGTIDEFVTDCFTPIRKFVNGPATNYEWTNIIVTYDGVSIKLFVNGLLYAFTNQTGTVINSSSSLLFGCGTSTSNCPALSAYFTGKLDDIGLWNRALTQEEITALYTSCNLNASISPSILSGQIQQNVLFNGNADSGSLVWQTNPNDIGWTNVPTNSTYSGQSSSTLGINNLQLSNHNQPFRLIATDGECIDTSDVAYIQILDTCVTNITTYDTISVAVEDTLNINTTISSVTPSQNNTFKVYPNPASTQLTIDNGNLSLVNGYSITIQNSLGQEVFNQPITQQVFIIDLNTWTGSGIYHLNILDNLGNVIENKKIVLQ